MSGRLRLPSFARLARGRALPWALSVLALAAAATFGALWWGERGQDERRAEVEATAGLFLAALTNFDAETIERDIAEIRSFAIGDFAGEVAQTFSAERVQAIRDGDASSRGRVRTVFVQDLGTDSASVFAVVDETVANAASPTPRTDVLRVELGLIETREAWKVSRVEILQSPGGGLVG